MLFETEDFTTEPDSYMPEESHHLALLQLKSTVEAMAKDYEVRKRIRPLMDQLARSERLVAEVGRGK